MVKLNIGLQFLCGFWKSFPFQKIQSFTLAVKENMFGLIRATISRRARVGRLSWLSFFFFIKTPFSLKRLLLSLWLGELESASLLGYHRTFLDYMIVFRLIYSRKSFRMQFERHFKRQVCPMPIN